jgi:hypothetical protein
LAGRAGNIRPDAADPQIKARESVRRDEAPLHPPRLPRPQLARSCYAANPQDKGRTEKNMHMQPRGRPNPDDSGIPREAHWDRPQRHPPYSQEFPKTRAAPGSRPSVPRLATSLSSWNSMGLAGAWGSTESLFGIASWRPRPPEHAKGHHECGSRWVAWRKRQGRPAARTRRSC